MALIEREANYSYLIMKNVLSLLLVAVMLQSCFPVSIPPNLDKGQLFEAKKFKRRLPNQYAYIFTDPKDANDFYYFISYRFPPNEEGDSEANVPIIVDNHPYYISFYETEKKSRIVNLLPSIANELLSQQNIPITLEEPPIVRDGTWYIALIITDEHYNDALSPKHFHQKELLEFAKTLQNQYLSTRNYESLLLQN